MRHLFRYCFFEFIGFNLFTLLFIFLSRFYREGFVELASILFTELIVLIGSICLYALNRQSYIETLSFFEVLKSLLRLNVITYLTCLFTFSGLSYL